MFFEVTSTASKKSSFDKNILLMNINNMHQFPLAQQVEFLQRYLIEREEEIERLRADNAELRAENAELRAENAELRAENAELRAENAEFRNRVASLLAGAPDPFEPSIDGVDLGNISHDVS